MTSIAIYVRDKGYGERLMEYLASKKSNMRFSLVTQEKSMSEIVKENKLEGLLLEEGLTCDSFDGTVLTLFENPGFPREEGIFKYQKGEDIFREVEKAFGKESNREREGCQVICVFSPEGNNGITSLATKVAKEQTKNGATLYLSLSPLPSIFQDQLVERPPEVQEGLSELLCMTYEEGLGERVEEQLFSYEGFHVLPPFRHYKDLLDLDMDDFEGFLGQLREMGRFQTIVIEVSQLFEHSLSVLALSDRIIFMSGTDLMSRIHYHVFCQYVEMEQQESLAERWEVIRDWAWE